MSQYWAAYYGDAIVLNETEFFDFCERYAFVHPRKDIGVHDVIDFEKYIFEGQEPRFVELQKSNSNEHFCFTEVLTSMNDGMYLIPHYYGGTPNNGEVSYDLRQGNVYAVFAEENRFSGDAFKNPPYRSYEELKREFKGCLERYLPADFDWDSHIGIFSYAAYA